MNIELTSDAEAWVQRGIAEGRFASPEDAILYAIDQAKLDELRRELIAADEEGGEYSPEEVQAYALSQLSGVE